MSSKLTSIKQARWRKGLRAERWAVFLLRLKGYSINEQRYTSPFGEIDIIAERSGVMVFVEVKSRTNFLNAKESIKPSQRRRIEKAATLYMAKRQHQGYGVRFDAILSVGWRLRHLVDAWRMGD